MSKKHKKRKKAAKKDIKKTIKNTSAKNKADNTECKAGGAKNTGNTKSKEKQTKTDPSKDKKAAPASTPVPTPAISESEHIVKQGNRYVFVEENTDIIKGSTDSTGSDGTGSGEIKSADKTKMNGENKLELATMSAKERRAIKKEAYRENTKDMSGAQKIAYFFYCYKWHIIIPICIILLFTAYGIAFYKNTRPVALSYAVLNSEAYNDSFHDDFLAHFNISKDYRIEGIPGYNIDYDYYRQNINSAIRDGSDYSTINLTCEAGTFDVIITDRAGIRYCAFVEIVRPLDLYFDAGTYAALEDHIMKFQDSSYKFYPYAIDISDTDFAKSLCLEYDDVYLAFPGVTEENTSNALRLLEYIYNIEL